MAVCLPQSGKAPQVSERIRTMAASASVLSKRFTSFSTSGDSMYCNRDRDNRLCSISSTSEAQLRMRTHSHTKVAAGHMPRSTLVIKTEGTKSIWLGSASSRFIPKTKLKCSVGAYSPPLWSKWKWNCFLYACLQGKLRWKCFIYM